MLPPHFNVIWKMAGGKKVQGNPSGLKWKGAEKTRETSKGIKPLPEPMTVKSMSVVLVMHICRKILLMDTLKKLAVYIAELIFGSLLCDFFPLPKIFFANKSNILNKYFAKFSWGWTFLLVGVFISLTSHVYCCGNRQRIKKHLSRLLVGTGCWYVFTQLFVYVESWSAVCVGGENERSRDRCLKQNLNWKGFDISGHAFLLIYCCLVIHEEAKAIKGWDKIRDLIREVNYDEDSALKNLSDQELSYLKTSYDKYDSYVKSWFVAITFLSLLWDFTLIGTILYYHTLAQKVAGGLVAMFAWFITYKCWFNTDFSPGLPGQGPFKYNFETARLPSFVEDRRRSIVGIRPPLRSFGMRNGPNGTPLDTDKSV